MGSSETKRETTDFEDWFIGFFEGDGSFSVSYSEKRVFMKIRQKEYAVLQKIHAYFGTRNLPLRGRGEIPRQRVSLSIGKGSRQFGSLYLSADGYWTYSVQGKDQILALIDAESSPAALCAAPL